MRTLVLLLFALNLSGQESIFRIDTTPQYERGPSMVFQIKQMRWNGDSLVLPTGEIGYSFSNRDTNLNFTVFKDSAYFKFRLQDSILHSQSIPPVVADFLMNQMMNRLQDNYDQMAVLRWKVRFYEEHFGELNGSPDDPCAHFSAKKKPAPLTQCLDWTQKAKPAKKVNVKPKQNKKSK